MGLISSRLTKQLDMDGRVANLVKEKIQANNVMVFSKSYCPYCKMAKQALDSVKATYEVMELENEADGSEIQDVLNQMTGARSVPRVFIGGKCIGGGSETQALLKSGELQKMIEAA